jgi:hypothetical protein
MNAGLRGLRVIERRMFCERTSSDWPPSSVLRLHRSLARRCRGLLMLLPGLASRRLRSTTLCCSIQIPLCPLWSRPSLEKDRS